jgi:hypothetical protein
VKHQVVERQKLLVGAYKRALCGSTTCQPGTSPGLEMQVVPDVTAIDPATLLPAFLVGAAIPTLPTDANAGWKDASIALPGEVTTIVARWDGGWNATGVANAPGTPGGPALGACPGGTGCSPPWIYESVTSGPYVWHCHINSHEDSEMMRTSMVVP